MLLTIDGHNLIRRFTGIDLDVYVDGVNLRERGVLSADSDAGWALVLKREADGRAYLDPVRGELAAEIVTGDVMFVRRADAEA